MATDKIRADIDFVNLYPRAKIRACTRARNLPRVKNDARTRYPRIPACPRIPIPARWSRMKSTWLGHGRREPPARGLGAGIGHRRCGDMGVAGAGAWAWTSGVAGAGTTRYQRGRLGAAARVLPAQTPRRCRRGRYGVWPWRLGAAGEEGERRPAGVRVRGAAPAQGPKEEGRGGRWWLGGVAAGMGREIR
jgi:hypothetical protein